MLGVVGVDSGQLIIIDPCYIQNDWNKEGRDFCVKFWGQGDKDVAEKLTSDGYIVFDMNGAYKVPTVNQNDLEHYIRAYAEEIGKAVVTSIQTGSTYEQVCETTGGPSYGGEVDLGVAFSSGLGDGSYEVYATIQEVPGWGERVTKVEIELIPDWELNHYREENGKE